MSRDLKRRLDNIVEKGLTVMVGDANGADRAVQRYLAGKHYDRVVVFCAAGGCRNNVGKWPIRDVAAAPGARGFAFYAAKDRAMAGQADYGLMVWDGRSRGTLASIVDLVRQGKPVVVYVSPKKRFATLRDPAQLSEWLSGFEADVIPRIEVDLQAEPTTGSHHRTADTSLF